MGGASAKSAVTATSRGRRIDRVPAEPVQRCADGRISVPVWLLRDGMYHSDLDLRLSSAEAELLCAQLTRALVAGGGR